MRVVGLDLSLASTGLACNDGSVDRIRTSPDESPAQLPRLRRIRSAVLQYTKKADLVVIEGMAISRQTGQHLTRAGLWHLVVDAIDAAGIPWAEVTTGQLKKYATGSGSAEKDDVLVAVVRRFPDYPVRGNDEADALVLAAMGADHLGNPISIMPAANRTALDKVAWPEVRP